MLVHIVISAAGLLCAERLSMDVAAGQAVLIEGPSGCGKSTLLRALGGLHPLDSGRVWLSPPDQVALTLASIIPRCCSPA